MEETANSISTTSVFPQIQISVPTNSGVDFSSLTIIEQLREVKREVKAVLEGANVDSQKLSIHFTV